MVEEFICVQCVWMYANMYLFCVLHRKKGGGGSSVNKDRHLARHK